MLDPTLTAEDEKQEADEVDAALRSLSRKERRRLFRAYGISKGARRKGGRLR